LKGKGRRRAKEVFGYSALSMQQAARLVDDVFKRFKEELKLKVMSNIFISFILYFIHFILFVLG
jgi:hypothetical protein